MNDQPNRPANRTDLATIREMEELGCAMFLDGVIEGLPIAKNIKLIVEQAVLFGRDEAGRSDAFYAKVRYDSIEDLIRDAVRNAVNDMFGGVGMNKVAHSVTLAGMAYGFQAEKHKMKYAGTVDALAKVVAEHKVGKVTDETADAFFGEVLKIEDMGVAIEYARQALTGHKIHFSTKVPNFIAFSQRYMTVLVDA